jgi:hypothetical protein
MCITWAGAGPWQADEARQEAEALREQLAALEQERSRVVSETVVRLSPVPAPCAPVYLTRSPCGNAST